MISFFDPAILFLHELGRAWILIIPDSWINIFDEILRPLPSFHILSVKAIILSKGSHTCLSIRLSLEE